MCNDKKGEDKKMPILARVYVFKTKDGKQQVASFPDTLPDSDTDLGIRIKHFTEIENFTLFGRDLGHELAGAARAFGPHVMLLQVDDPEFATLLSEIQATTMTDEELGDQIADVGLNWEHFVASNNNLMIPGHPKVVSDSLLQQKINALEAITEALVEELNFRSVNPL
jgi:hypothetical protein